MITISPLWLQIVSELLVDVAAGWFAVVFIEPRAGLFLNLEAVLLLTIKFFLGIVTLYFAKHFREEALKI